MVYTFAWQIYSRRRTIERLNQTVDLAEEVGFPESCGWFLRRMIPRYALLILEALIFSYYLYIAFSSGAQVGILLLSIYWMHMQLVLQTLACIYYWQLTLQTLLFRVLNEKLSKDMGIIQNIVKKNKSNIWLLCSISDDIDKCIQFHYRLCQSNDASNGASHWNILLNVVTLFFNLLLNLFLGYHTFNTDKFNLISLVYVTRGVFTTYSMTNACAELTTNSVSTREVLNHECSFYDLDVRVTRTVRITNW